MKGKPRRLPVWHHDHTISGRHLHYHAVIRILHHQPCLHVASQYWLDSFCIAQHLLSFTNWPVSFGYDVLDVKWWLVFSAPAECFYTTRNKTKCFSSTILISPVGHGVVQSSNLTSLLKVLLIFNKFNYICYHSYGKSISDESANRDRRSWGQILGYYRLHYFIHFIHFILRQISLIMIIYIYIFLASTW